MLGGLVLIKVCDLIVRMVVHSGNKVWDLVIVIPIKMIINGCQ